jgi:pathogenesis-related protein 1
MTIRLTIISTNSSLRRFYGFLIAVPILFCFVSAADAQPRNRTTKNAAKSSTKSGTKKAPKEVIKDVAVKCPGDKGLPLESITELLSAQNTIRTQLKLTNFTWNCQMADYAQEWANRGIFEHRSNNKYGENIYVSSNGDVTLTNVVDKWVTERDFWNNNTGVCKDGKICSHYTQIIWRATRQIGCGINRNVTGKWKVLLVCNYDPPGDVDSPAY